jgi:hypothetical protein
MHSAIAPAPKINQEGEPRPSTLVYCPSDSLFNHPNLALPSDVEAGCAKINLTWIFWHASVAGKHHLASYRFVRRQGEAC